MINIIAKILLEKIIIILLDFEYALKFCRYCTCLAIFSTLSCISCTVEQSFTTLRRLKSLPRSIIKKKTQKHCTSGLCIDKEKLN